jgi:hypothetical protein
LTAAAGDIKDGVTSLSSSAADAGRRISVRIQSRVRELRQERPLIILAAAAVLACALGIFVRVRRSKQNE